MSNWVPLLIILLFILIDIRETQKVFGVGQADLWKMMVMSPAEKIHKKIDNLLEELNSRYPDERMSLDETELPEGLRSFSVKNEAGSIVISVWMRVGGKVTVIHYDNTPGKSFGDVKSLLKHVDEFLREYHQSNVVEFHQCYPHPA